MTKAEILASVKTRTGRTDLTDIDAELLAILVDATARHAFLKTTASQSWASGMRSIAFPTGATRILHITERLTSSTSGENEPLARIPFKQYLSYAASDADTGEPSEFATDNSLIYPYTIPNAAYTATVYYQYTHPSDLATISLDDRFKECVTSGVCFIVMGGQLGMPDENSIHYKVYESQLAMLASKVMDEQTETVAGYY
jgi:hypothetical protein